MHWPGRGAAAATRPGSAHLALVNPGARLGGFAAFGQAHDVVALTSSTARARAQALTAQISAATSRYVALCRAAGIPVRDIAFLLGITRSG
jgi:hypothetical protein